MNCHGRYGIPALCGTQPPRLSAEEIAALPNGTRIIVTWDGGNGPHEYVIRNDLDAHEIYLTTNVRAGSMGPLDYVSLSPF